MNLVLKALPPTILGIYGPNKIMPERMRYLHPEAADSFMKLENSGMRIRVSDMYRSAEASLDAIRTKKGTKAPGYSGHNYGFSIDIDVDDCMKRLGFKTKEELDKFMESHGWYCFRLDHKLGRGEMWHYNCFFTNPSKYLQYDNTGSREAGLEVFISDLYGQYFKLNNEQVQETLKKKGFYSGDVDGILGPISTQAIKMFQNAFDLKATGVADVRTQRTLAFFAADKTIVS